MTDRFMQSKADDDPAGPQQARTLGSEVGAGPATGAAAVPASAVTTSLTTLLTSHILHDGELVLLILKPSIWFVLLSSLRFIAGTLILCIAGVLWGDAIARRNLTWADIGGVLIAGRLMWAVLQWMGRVYVLTDMRIVRLAGVFAIDVFDCPLRKVARVRLTRTAGERVCGLASLQIIPGDDELPVAAWDTIARPREVREQVVAAINRAKHCGG